MESIFPRILSGIPLDIMREAFAYAAGERVNWPALAVSLFGIPTLAAAQWALATVTELIATTPEIPVALAALGKGVLDEKYSVDWPHEQLATEIARHLGAHDCIAHLGAIECDISLHWIILPFFLRHLACSAVQVAETANEGPPWFRARLVPAPERDGVQQFVATNLRPLGSNPNFTPPHYEFPTHAGRDAALHRLLCPRCAPGPVRTPDAQYFGHLGWIHPQPAGAPATGSPAAAALANAHTAFALQLAQRLQCGTDELPERLLPSLTARGNNSPMHSALMALASTVCQLPPLEGWADYWVSMLRPDSAEAAAALLQLTPELVRRQSAMAASAAAAELMRQLGNC